MSGDASPHQVDLTGYWSGEYWYDAGMGSLTQFAAHINDVGGSFEGTTLETANIGFGSRELTACITGSRNGADVEFVKRYDVGQSAHREPIFYAGTIDADLTFIEGRWLLTEWIYRLTGGFRMRRRGGGLKAAVRRQAREPVLAGVESTGKPVVVVPGTRKQPKPPRNLASRWLDLGVLGGVRAGRYVTRVS